LTPTTPQKTVLTKRAEALLSLIKTSILFDVHQQRYKIKEISITVLQHMGLVILMHEGESNENLTYFSSQNLFNTKGTQ